MLAASRRPTISSRPLGVRRAFLCTVALSPGKETDVSQHQLPPTSGREQPSENSHLGGARLRFAGGGGGRGALRRRARAGAELGGRGDDLGGGGEALAAALGEQA